MKDKQSHEHPGVTVDLPVEILSEGSVSRGRATALASVGMCLAVTSPLAIGTEIEIRFRPAKHLPVMHVKARVLSQVPEKGATLEFTEIDPTHREALLRLIVHRRRAQSRVRLVTQVESPQCGALALSRDISEGGMFIETKQPLPVDTQLHLRFYLEAGGPLVTADAKVAYEVVGLGMGIQFVDISQSDGARIHDYVLRSQRLTAETLDTESET